MNTALNKKYFGLVPLQHPVAVCQSDGRHRIIKHTAADEVVIPMGQKGLPCRLVTGGDPAHAQPRQREYLGHTADRYTLFVQIGNGGAPVIGLSQVAVYLVAEDIGIHAAGNIHDLL